MTDILNKSKHPMSCDTFVVLPKATLDGTMIFAKNSDRPRNEVQEVIQVKGGKPTTKKIKCTYIEVYQSFFRLNDVILSKPAWMWGAEMGSNEKGVSIGCESVWTACNKGDGNPNVKRLIGPDFVRLGLERGVSALHALLVITNLLQTYGQGGPCSEFDEAFCYHNSFLLADPKDAWVLETSGKFWVAQKVRGLYRNISNGLTIRTKFDLMSEDLLYHARRLNLWNGQGYFDFAASFSVAGTYYSRQPQGEALLQNFTRNRTFTLEDMFCILRNKMTGICRGCEDEYPTQGSQVSCLSEFSPDVHWFTCTPDPAMSVYKPFIFSRYAVSSEHTASDKDDDRHMHKLFMLHNLNYGNLNNLHLLRVVEQEWIRYVSTFLDKYERRECDMTESAFLMVQCVDTELTYY